MEKLKLLLDINVLIDFLNEREPYFERTRLLMAAGKVGEFSLWISATQMTDLIYVLTGGGRTVLMPEALDRLRALRTFVNVAPVDDVLIDRMFATLWHDAEEALLFEVALSIKADAIVTRSKAGFETDAIRVVDCEEFFTWLESERGVTYDEVLL